MTRKENKKERNFTDIVNSLVPAIEHMGPFVHTGHKRMDKILNKLYIQLRLCGMPEQEVKAVIQDRYGIIAKKLLCKHK